MMVMLFEDDDVIVSLRRCACAKCPEGVPSIEGSRCKLVRDDVGRLDPVEHRRRMLQKSPAGCPAGRWATIREVDGD